jgi:hypothetical protein
MCYVVHDPQRARQSNDIVPIGGRAGADLVEADDQTLCALLAALTVLDRLAYACSIPQACIAST